MDKRKIDQDVYDRYVDATVALFMEYYCATLSEDIHQQFDDMQTNESTFPDALDIRCRTAIKKEYAMRKRKQHIKSLLKGLRYVASFAIVLLALASILFVSVEAIRVPIINYYISQNDQYLEFTSRQSDEAGSIENINAEGPLAGILPEEYELISLDNILPTRITAIYKNSNGDCLYFSIDTSATILRVDSENTQTVKAINICGCDGILVTKDGTTTITWGYESDEKTFMLASSELTETELVKLAKSFMQNIS